MNKYSCVKGSKSIILTPVSLSSKIIYAAVTLVKFYDNKSQYTFVYALNIWKSNIFLDFLIHHNIHISIGGLL